MTEQTSVKKTDDPPLAERTAAVSGGQPPAGDAVAARPSGQGKPVVQPPGQRNPAAAQVPASVDMPELSDTGAAESGGGDRNLDVILDIPVTISMEIGRTRIPIRNLLQLNQGSVVELERLAGEPLDVLVNGTLIAHGEVVVVNERFGIRFTDVVSLAERVQKLR